MSLAHHHMKFLPRIIKRWLYADYLCSLHQRREQLLLDIGTARRLHRPARALQDALDANLRALVRVERVLE